MTNLFLISVILDVRASGDPHRLSLLRQHVIHTCEEFQRKTDKNLLKVLSY